MLEDNLKLDVDIVGRPEDKNSHRNLATIQKIKDLRPIDGADKIELCIFESIGYVVVVQKGAHQVGDLVCYICQDSIVPEHEVFEFLRPHKFRIKTIKLRGQVSMGIVLPLKEVDRFWNSDYDRVEGFDLTDIIKVEHWTKPIPAQLSGQTEGYFPTSIITKTDEDNIESYPGVINEFKKVDEVYVATKQDGSSASFIKTLPNKTHGCNDVGSRVYVCSRNLILKEGENSFWRAAKKYDLENVISEGWALQMELVGCGIQKNPMKLKDIEIRVFNLWGLFEDKHAELQDWDITQQFCKERNLPLVEEVYRGPFKWNSIGEMEEEFGDVRYPCGSLAEGVIFRGTKPGWSHTLRKMLSVKLVNKKYLLKHGE